MSSTPAYSGSPLARLRVIAGNTAPYPDDYEIPVRTREIREVLDLIDVLGDAVTYAARHGAAVDPDTVRALLTDFGARLDDVSPSRRPLTLPAVATTEDAPVLVAWPTINSGLVMRWYASDSESRQEVASASREGFTIGTKGAVRPELGLARVVVEVAAYIRDVVYGRPFGTADSAAYATVTALATHRPEGLFRTGLIPVERAAR